VTATVGAGLVPAAKLTLEHHGAVRLDRAAFSSLADLRALADALPKDRAGVRLQGIAAHAQLLAPHGPLGALASSRLGPGTRAVRAIMFDKTPDTNWALGWHQDRTIVVRKRLDTDGFGPWTVKAGMIHVEPPAAMMAGMLTMRVHLDDVPETNAPLSIAPGSHRLGRIPEQHVEAIVAKCGTVTCLAEAGDVWLYATPILHASNAASGAGHRRVLQVDFAATDLPQGLEWLEV
jgi:hypothetical protein